MKWTRVLSIALALVATLGVLTIESRADNNPPTKVQKSNAAQPVPVIQQSSQEAQPGNAASAKPQTAIFAGGCFWSMEVQFESRPGVLSVVSGYSGGHTSNPTYEEVSTGMTGHKESVEVKFDPSKITYDQLLDIYWHGIDPTQSDGQFCDRGDEYQSVVFYRDEAQHQAGPCMDCRMRFVTKDQQKCGVAETEDGCHQSPLYCARRTQVSFGFADQEHAHRQQ